MTNRNDITWYYALDEAMLVAHREHRDDYAESTARLLLEHAELPLLIRARACMILACSSAPDAMDMAREAVRVAELGYSLCDNPGEFEQQLVDDAKALLAEAEALARAEEGGDGKKESASDAAGGSACKSKIAISRDFSTFVSWTDLYTRRFSLLAAEQMKGSRRMITDSTKMMVSATKSPPFRDRRPG